MKPLFPLIKTINEYASAKIPFVCITDFLLDEPLLFTLDELDQQNIKVSFPGFSNTKIEKQATEKISIHKKPISRSSYQASFEKVKRHLHYGNSFLTNLTAQTPISINANLETIFDQAVSKYKILFRDQWLCFSPETFITIKNGIITSRPMKGTIDASIPNATGVILNDAKEKAEHYTIVDLIRNDLGSVGTAVKVEQFRYIEKLQTSEKDLLQVSSEISAVLPDNYQQQLGEILFALLPAGSVSGAPKRKTLDIIQEAETYRRGYYTGVAFYFDGENTDSCVLIRFIEKTADGYVYKSGGGITIHSELEKEYQELIDKIYVPFS